MESEQLDEIMKCSKEAIARAYLCNCIRNGCIMYPDSECPFGVCSCKGITPQDWEGVLDERNGGEACITE